jgi:hypothetical protein
MHNRFNSYSEAKRILAENERLWRRCGYYKANHERLLKELAAATRQLELMKLLRSGNPLN